MTSIHSSPIQPVASSAVRYALQDRTTLEKYPLRGCQSYADAFDALESCRAGEDAGLLIPPRRGAELRILILHTQAEEFRRVRQEAARQAHIDAEIAILFPLYRRNIKTGFAERIHRLFCRTDLTVIVLAVGAAALLLRRLL